jgi:hypothetical protein
VIVLVDIPRDVIHLIEHHILATPDMAGISDTNQTDKTSRWNVIVNESLFKSIGKLLSSQLQGWVRSIPGILHFPIHLLVSLLLKSTNNMVMMMTPALGKRLICLPAPRASMAPLRIKQLTNSISTLPATINPTHQLFWELSLCRLPLPKCTFRSATPELPQHLCLPLPKPKTTAQ